MREDDESAAQLRAIAERLNLGRLRLQQTIAGIQKRRRTPDQRDDIRHRSRALIYRSHLIRRKILRYLTVH